MREEEIMRLGCFRDKTYCASPNCKNECGRQMSKEIESILKADNYSRTSYAYFCGEPEYKCSVCGKPKEKSDSFCSCAHI